MKQVKHIPGIIVVALILIASLPCGIAEAQHLVNLLLAASSPALVLSAISSRFISESTASMRNIALAM